MSTPRVFDQHDDIPEDVTAVRGYDGSGWVRNTDRAAWGTDEEWCQAQFPDMGELSTTGLLDTLAPLTEEPRS